MNRIFCKSMKRATMLALCATLMGTMPALAQDNTAPPPPPQQEAPPPPQQEAPPPPQQEAPPPQDHNMAPPPSQDNSMPAREGHHRGMRMDSDRHMQRMTKELNLSQDQASQIKAIDDDTMKQVEAVRSDSSIAQADKRSKIMDIHKASQDKVRAVLNDEQKTKYDAMMTKQGRRGNRKGGEATTPQEPPPPPTPPQ